MLRMAHTYISDPKTPERIANWCKTDDFKYASKFKKEARKQQSLAARCLIRMLAANYWEIGSNELTIATGGQGELVLQLPTSKQKLWASLSHSHDFVCAILSDHTPVGIDVEFCDPDRDITPLVTQIYPPFNADALTAYKFWTLNEAHGKARGIGIDFSNMDFCYQLANTQHNTETTGFKTFLQEGHVISVYCDAG